MTKSITPLPGCLAILVGGSFGLLAILSVIVGPSDQRHGFLVLFCIFVIAGGIWMFVSVIGEENELFSEADQLIESAKNIKENADSRDTLTGAAWNSDWSKVKLLLESGADVNQANSQGQTALDLARARRDKQLINLLLSYGAKNSDDEMQGLG